MADVLRPFGDLWKKMKDIGGGAHAEVVSIDGSVTVSGGLTDTQLRVAPVPVSGPATDAQLRATPLPVSTPAGPTAGTPTSVANATGDTLALAANAARKGATIFNDDTATTGATAKISLGTTTASATVFTYAIPPQGYYEVPFGYTGMIRFTASAATGALRINELT